jgi:hypothetical protein
LIRVARPALSPARLETHGAPDLARLCALFDADPVGYSAGKKTLDFQSGIYGHASVKAVLQRAQYDKCCYCEGIFHGHAAGDVDHFRPKGYCQQGPKSSRYYPGYYWLAYQWDNLLFSCQVCNRSYKRNLFPLADPLARALSRTEDTTREAPLLLDPSGPDDPREHIQFHEDVPRGITEMGRTTVDVLKLDRVALNDRRREKLNTVRTLRSVVTLLADDASPEAVATVADARAELRKVVEPSSAYSAMVLDFINPRPLL